MGEAVVAVGAEDGVVGGDATICSIHNAKTLQLE